MSKPFYITTTIPYVNADPHVGFALELVSADIIARYKKLAGFEVFFNTGTDEHGLKVYRKALEERKDLQAYVDGYAKKYQELIGTLDVLTEVNFIRTTDQTHKKAAQEFWRRCSQNGFIYKKLYKVKYCVGCELEKTDSELENGHCPIHPNLEIELIEEENYFFKLSAFTDYLSKFYERSDFVVPDFRLNELRSLISEKGLEDFSASRLASKVPWGIPVPDDSQHVMYVWFDAFVNYISAVGWPDDMDKFDKWWVQSGGVVQFAGKDQVRQQAAMWQAMLKASGIETPSKQIVIHGFITTGGEKMSKSLGNVIDPGAIVKEYGTDALRYYLARHINPFEDSDFTMEKFKEAYNANLANGLGNLVSRTLAMAEKNGVRLSEKREALDSGYLEALDKFEINKAADIVWGKIAEADARIQETEPFKKIKTNPDEARRDMAELLSRLYEIALHLKPILPKTSEIILDLVSSSKVPITPIFTRKD
ncbi:MAG: methionine--tRNA ligase [bacterium]|nr:methionine--tRNA ligase [bacterium]